MSKDALALVLPTIFRFVAPYIPHLLDTETSWDGCSYASILACAVVCKSWTWDAQTALFAHITTQRRNESFSDASYGLQQQQRLLHALQMNSRLRHVVRSLVLACNATMASQVKSIMILCGNVSTVSLAIPFTSADLETDIGGLGVHFNIRSLVLCEPSGRIDLRTIACMLPRLNRLHVLSLWDPPTLDLLPSLASGEILPLTSCSAQDISSNYMKYMAAHAKLTRLRVGFANKENLKSLLLFKDTLEELQIEEIGGSVTCGQLEDILGQLSRLRNLGLYKFTGWPTRWPPNVKCIQVISDNTFYLHRTVASWMVFAEAARSMNELVLLTRTEEIRPLILESPTNEADSSWCTLDEVREALRTRGVVVSVAPEPISSFFLGDPRDI